MLQQVLVHPEAWELQQEAHGRVCMQRLENGRNPSKKHSDVHQGPGQETRKRRNNIALSIAAKSADFPEGGEKPLWMSSMGPKWRLRSAPHPARPSWTSCSITLMGGEAADCPDLSAHCFQANSHVAIFQSSKQINKRAPGWVLCSQAPSVAPKVKKNNAQGQHLLLFSIS